MLSILIILICCSILVSGLLAACLDNLMAAMVSAGLASLFASISYVLLASPDAAMAEASIGSGLATLIFLYAIKRTNGGED